MKKIDDLLKKAAEIQCVQYEDYDYSKLTTEELKELIREDTSEERMLEILEPVKCIKVKPAQHCSKKA